MIQRIQTLFLLLVIVLLGFFFFVPFVSYIVEPQMYKFSLLVTGITSDKGSPDVLFPVWALMILVAVAMATSLITILLYKRRMVQIRLCIFNAVLLIGLQGLLYYVAVSVGNMLQAKPDYGLVFIFPLIASILTFLAIRAITKDEALIRSLNRLR